MAHRKALSRSWPRRFVLFFHQKKVQFSDFSMKTCVVLYSRNKEIVCLKLVPTTYVLSSVLIACVDPESFVRGGPTFFFSL